MNNELRVKLERVRGLIKDEGVDGIYIKRQDNFAWLTCGGRNYVGVGEVGNCGLLVLPDSLYAITTNIEEPRMRNEEELEKLGFKILAGVWPDTGFEKNTLSKLVPSEKLATDTGKFADKIRMLRFDLTPEEIERYKKIGYDASYAMESTLLDIAPGLTEYEIAGRVMDSMEKFGLELLSCMVAADERIRLYRHPLPTNKRVEGCVQVGGNFRRNGLVICMTRYVYFERPSDALLKQYQDTQLIDCTYMGASQPGRKYSDALREGQAQYEKLGYGDEFSKHHQGGPIGYAGRDYRVDFNTNGPIAEHQAFCWNPSITGTKSEDTVICTSNDIIPVTCPVLFPKTRIVVDNRVFIRPAILVK